MLYFKEFQEFKKIFNELYLQRGTKEPHYEGERREWKSHLKTQHSENKDHGIQSHHFMANRWGKKTEIVIDFIYLGSKITADADCSHESKRHLSLGRKAMMDLDSILKTTSITLLTKVCIAIYTFFPVVMYGCDSWTIKKVEYIKIDTFKLWCWRRLLRVPWSARRSNQTILKKSVLSS